jgi:hypothetical protein
MWRYICIMNAGFLVSEFYCFNMSWCLNPSTVLSCTVLTTVYLYLKQPFYFLIYVCVLSYLLVLGAFLLSEFINSYFEGRLIVVNQMWLSLLALLCLMLVLGSDLIWGISYSDCMRFGIYMAVAGYIVVCFCLLDYTYFCNPKYRSQNIVTGLLCVFSKPY